MVDLQGVQGVQGAFLVGPAAAPADRSPDGA